MRDYVVCSVCEKMYDREDMREEFSGYGCKIVNVRKNFLEKKKIMFPIMKKVCRNCQGDKKIVDVSSNEKMAAAAGFKRYAPPTR